jgi:hypothetical protein
MEFDEESLVQKVYLGCQLGVGLELVELNYHSYKFGTQDVKLDELTESKPKSIRKMVTYCDM